MSGQCAGVDGNGKEVNCTRRFFIGGTAAFGALGAFGGARFLTQAGKPRAGAPNLRLGVISDIHVKCMGRDKPVASFGNCHTFRHALEWFRDQEADAVVIAGDMADSGVISQLEAVATTWNEVFPDGKAPGGRPVERLFVSGNHDMGGVPYARFWLKGQSDGEIEKQIISSDLEGVWQRLFGEPYAPIWHKTVRGYSFVGANWLVPASKGDGVAFNGRIADFYSAISPQIDPKLPFFHIQHPHPRGTCHGDGVWGQDVGLSTKTLSRFPNAISLSGHSHVPLTDPRFIWQGAFTSVGTGSLSYCGPADKCAPPVFTERRAWDCRMGLLMSVYDDCLVVRRREFLSDLDAGDELVLPLPAAEPRPFAFAEHARRLASPEFAAGTKVEVRRERQAVVVSVPPPEAVESARFGTVEFAVAGAKDVKAKYVQCPQTFYPRGHRKAAMTLVCTFETGELPPKEFQFKVTPINGFGRRGKPLVSNPVPVAAARKGLSELPRRHSGRV